MSSSSALTLSAASALRSSPSTNPPSSDQWDPSLTLKVCRPRCTGTIVELVSLPSGFAEVGVEVEVEVGRGDRGIDSRRACNPTSITTSPFPH